MELAGIPWGDAASPHYTWFPLHWQEKLGTYSIWVTVRAVP